MRYQVNVVERRDYGAGPTTAITYHGGMGRWVDNIVAAAWYSREGAAQIAVTFNETGIPGCYHRVQSHFVEATR